MLFKRRVSGQLTHFLFYSDCASGFVGNYAWDSYWWSAHWFRLMVYVKDFD